MDDSGNLERERATRGAGAEASEPGADDATRGWGAPPAAPGPPGSPAAGQPGSSAQPFGWEGRTGEHGQQQGGWQQPPQPPGQGGWQQPPQPPGQGGWQQPPQPPGQGGWQQQPPQGGWQAPGQAGWQQPPGQGGWQQPGQGGWQQPGAAWSAPGARWGDADIPPPAPVSTLGVNIAGLVLLVLGLLAALMGGGLLSVFSNADLMNSPEFLDELERAGLSPETLRANLPALQTSGVVLLVLGIGQVVGGIGTLVKRTWGRVIGIVGAAVGLLLALLGLAAGFNVLTLIILVAYAFVLFTLVRSGEVFRRR